MLEYKTSNVCAKKIEIDVKDNIIKSVKFSSGCPGNLIGISNLVKNMDINEAISKLEGITCGSKPTSCPDQLAKALKSLL